MRFVLYLIIYRFKITVSNVDPLLAISGTGINTGTNTSGNSSSKGNNSNSTTVITSEKHINKQNLIEIY